MKEKLLFLTAYVPNKAAAGEKNTMIMLNELADSYDVDLIYFKYNWEKDYIPEKDNIKTVLKIKNSLFVKVKNILNYPFIHPTFSIRFNWYIQKKVTRLIRNNDYKVVVFNHSNMFTYGKFIDVKIPKILLCHDVIAQRVMRSSSYIMQKICLLSEKKALSLPNAHIFSFSQKDCDLINHIYGLNANLCLDYIDNNILTKKPQVINDYFVMFGDWRRKENRDGALWFIENVSPLFKRNVVIKIIGRNFPENIKVENPNLKLEILGFVEDPYDLITQSKALISPLFAGAGIKVKVIESLACGTPVIGTEIAFEGLPTSFNSFMILANKPAEYLSAIENIKFDVIEREALKNDFIRSYQSESITSYIMRL